MPSYPIFIVIPQAAARLLSLPHLGPQIAQVAQTARAAGVDLYYRNATDMAMLALRLDPRLATSQLLEELQASIARLGGALLDPGRLPLAARKNFQECYLPLFEYAVGAIPSSAEALAILERRLREEVAIARRRTVDSHLEVRYRRGDAWHLARLRTVTKDGISIATATPPRQGDTVDIEISYGGEQMEIRSSVVGVTSNEVATALGAQGFGARFLIPTAAERSRLETLLNSAGGDKLRELEPPPRRQEARFPIRWPVFLRTNERKVSLRALDISRHGMFVAAEATDPGEGQLRVAFPADDKGPPIVAQARIARQVPASIGRARGIAPGYGLELTSMTSADDARLGQFVKRIGRRAEREIVVGAAQGRLDELIGALTAIGYHASGASDAPELVAKTAAADRVPDLVVIDVSLGRSSPRSVDTARRALAVRQIPAIVLDGDSAVATREYVDGALLQ